MVRSLRARRPAVDSVLFTELADLSPKKKVSPRSYFVTHRCHGFKLCDPVPPCWGSSFSKVTPVLNEGGSGLLGSRLYLSRSLFTGSRPLNLPICIPLSTFMYSSQIFMVSLDRMVSTPSGYVRGHGYPVIREKLHRD